MQLDPGLRGALSLDAMAAWRDWISAAMQAMAMGEAAFPPRPSATEVDSLDRITRQIELMAGAMARLG